jgi:hypothetical protein
VHPGNAPVHAAGSTQFEIAETNRQFKQDTEDHLLYLQVTNELRQQLLTSIPGRYLSVLEDPIYGYSDVSLQAMLAHLVVTYGTIKQQDIEDNRLKLTAPWNLEDAIESLWNRIADVQRFALQAGQALPDESAIFLTLEVFSKTGLLPLAIRDWNKKSTPDKTLANFKIHFTAEIDEYNLQLTAKTAGYHGAHNATVIETSPDAPTNSANATSTNLPATIPHITTGDTIMYYCWTHGLGKNQAHTSNTCSNKADGHQDHATATNMMGGNDRIMKPRPSGTAGRGGRGPGRVAGIRRAPPSPTT